MSKELPYTYEEYIHARGRIHLASHGNDTTGYAPFSEARREAAMIWTSNEQLRLFPGEINTREKLYSFDILSALKPKLPPVSSGPGMATFLIRQQAARAAGVSAFAGRGISVPVKLPPKRVQHTKQIDKVAAAKNVKSDDPTKSKPAEKTRKRTREMDPSDEVPAPKKDKPTTSASSKPAKNIPESIDEVAGSAVEAPKAKKLKLTTTKDAMPAKKLLKRSQPQDPENVPTTKKVKYTTDVDDKPAEKSLKRHRDGKPTDDVPATKKPDDNAKPTEKSLKRHRDEESPDYVPATKKVKAATGSADMKPKPTLHPGSVMPMHQLVMNGTWLPVDEITAIKVSNLRRQFLEQHFKGVAKKVSKNKSSKVVPDSRLMPEYFTIADGDEDAVRCTCGCTKDDGQELVACDECDVWQHKECMGEAVPEDLDNDEYLCHQCDPWSHRNLIQKLRLASGIHYTGKYL